jgi:signal transduction histidine kinase/CheY-like chemotaxis protein
MKKRSEPEDSWEQQLSRIIGLGKRSVKKSYYPQLQVRISQLESANAALEHEIAEHEKTSKKKEKLELQLRKIQKVEAIGTLAGGIAHDFNNILAAIYGYTELAMNLAPPASSLHDYLESVLAAASRAKDLVGQILTFSRQVEQERKPVLLSPLVKEAVKLLRSAIPTTIEIQQLIDDHSIPVLADLTQIHQVIMNLCTNAYHAMRENEAGGVLGVSLREKEIGPDELAAELQISPGRYLVLEVSDTGCGMSKSILERIFDPYFTTKKSGEGTGLGLSIVHGIVASHGGRISVYSEPGQGSTFRVYLPAVKPVEAKVAKGEAEMVRGGSELVMLVDDEPEILCLLQKMLQGYGYRVAPYTTAEAALQAFRAEPRRYDLIITDMTMPQMTGAQLVPELLKIRADIPVILCTGFSELINEEKAKSIGVKKYLMKPVPTSELAQAVREALDER